MADGTLKVGTITTSSGSGTITIPSGNKITGHMYPAFQAYLSSSQSIANDTTVKVQFDTTDFDTDSCYSTSTYKFKPTIAGKYLLYLQVYIESLNDDSMQARFYKNDNILTISAQITGTKTGSNSLFASVIDTANGSTDEYHVTAYQDSGSAKNVNGNSSNKRSYFGAYRIGS